MHTTVQIRKETQNCINENNLKAEIASDSTAENCSSGIGTKAVSKLMTNIIYKIEVHVKWIRHEENAPVS